MTEKSSMSNDIFVNVELFLPHTMRNIRETSLFHSVDAVRTDTSHHIPAMAPPLPEPLVYDRDRRSKLSPNKTNLPVCSTRSTS
jgi:hypothetical protein